MQGQYETRISQRNLSQICGQHMTPSELISFLQAGALYRSFADVLRSVYPGEDLADRLKAQLSAQAEMPLTPKELDSSERMFPIGSKEAQSLRSGSSFSKYVLRWAWAKQKPVVCWPAPQTRGFTIVTPRSWSLPLPCARDCPIERQRRWIGKWQRFISRR